MAMWVLRLPPGRHEVYQGAPRAMSPSHQDPSQVRTGIDTRLSSLSVERSPRLVGCRIGQRRAFRGAPYPRPRPQDPSEKAAYLLSQTSLGWFRRGARYLATAQLQESSKPEDRYPR